MKYIFAIPALLLGTAATAQNADLNTVVTESIGYFNLAPGLVIIEGNEDQPNRVCQISVPDEAFAAGGAGASYDCFTLSETGNETLSDYIDASVGYFSVRPGVFVVEGEEGSVICQMEVSDDYMAARKINNVQAQADHLPSATCIALSEIAG